jgi:hypothetical protein
MENVFDILISRTLSLSPRPLVPIAVIVFLFRRGPKSCSSFSCRAIICLAKPSIVYFKRFNIYKDPLNVYNESLLVTVQE